MSISGRYPCRKASAIWPRCATRAARRCRAWLLVESFPEGELRLEWCEHYQLEGIVSKRLSSRYSSGTCRDWQKTKYDGWRKATSSAISCSRGQEAHLV